MLSLELVGVVAVAYAALVYVVIRTRLSKSEVRSNAELEKSVWTSTRRGR
jgi:hypothetical protein